MSTVLTQLITGEDRIEELMGRKPTRRAQAFYDFGWECARRDHEDENSELTLFPGGVGAGIKGMAHALLAEEEGWIEPEIARVVEYGRQSYLESLSADA